MRILAVAALTLSAACQPVMAKEIPADLNQHPEKFCLVAAVMGNFIMERRNRGEPLEYLYEEVAQLEQPQLRAYTLETVTLASQFPYMTPGKEFSQWRYEQCMRVMTPQPAEVYEIVDGKLKKTD